MREPSVIHTEQLLRILPRVPASVRDAMDRRERLALSLEEARAERSSIRVEANPDEWRSWREAVGLASIATVSLDRVIEAMVALQDPTDLAIVRAATDSADEIHGILVMELAALLADARKAADSFRGAPIPAGDAVPHLAPAKQAAWRVLDGAVARYAGVREGARQLRWLTGGPQVDPNLSELRDVAHPALWGGLNQWRYRKVSGQRPGPSSDRPIEYLAWLASLPEGLVWLPTLAEERAAFEAVRLKMHTKAETLGAFVLTRKR
ncbi:MAG TPA: hypothetical protein VIP78_13595 [Candidatus Dormibacteraeota bacterium]|jgi:hypothetical protein